MPTHLSVFSLLVTVAVALPIQTAGARQPETIKLQGNLLKLEFFGPPNYGESPKTDRREQALVLQLPATAKAQGVLCKESGAELCTALTEATFIQLAPPMQQSKRYASLVGRKVQIEGVPFLAESGHHRTKVMLQPKSIGSIEAWAWQAK